MDNVKNTIKALFSGKPLKSKILSEGESWSTVQCWRLFQKDEGIFCENEETKEVITESELYAIIDSEKNFARLAEDDSSIGEYFSSNRNFRIPIWLVGDQVAVRIQTQKNIPKNEPPYSEEQVDRILAVINKS